MARPVADPVTWAVTSVTQPAGLSAPSVSQIRTYGTKTAFAAPSSKPGSPGWGVAASGGAKKKSGLPPERASEMSNDGPETDMSVRGESWHAAKSRPRRATRARFTDTPSVYMKPGRGAHSVELSY